MNTTTTATTTTTTTSDAEWLREVQRRQIRMLPDLREQEHHSILYFTSLTPRSAAERSDRGLERQVASEPSGRRPERETQRREERTRSASVAEDSTGGRQKKQEKKKKAKKTKTKKASWWSFNDFDLNKHQAAAVRRFTAQLHDGPGRIS